MTSDKISELLHSHDQDETCLSVQTLIFRTVGPEIPGVLLNEISVAYDDPEHAYRIKFRRLNMGVSWRNLDKENVTAIANMMIERHKAGTDGAHYIREVQ